MFAEETVPSEDPPKLLLGQGGYRFSSLFYQLIFFDFNQLLSNIFSVKFPLPEPLNKVQLSFLKAEEQGTRCWCLRCLSYIVALGCLQ